MAAKPEALPLLPVIFSYIYCRMSMLLAQGVEDYLVLCKEAGKEPQKTFKGSFNIRISPELHKAAAIIR